jgi:hypothetical protein
VRQLHVLGVSEDGQALLLGPSAGKASHRLPLDEKLRAVVRGQLSAVGVERAESALSPKEMQARMREGATPEEVAKEAQVPIARVLPYAAPVIAERERIVEQARGSVLHRSRGPNGLRPLGEVVDAHLSEAAGLKPESVEWTARRRRDGAWVVLLAYAARGGRRAATWLWRPVERDLTALDPSASRLAAEETSTPRRKAATKRPATARPAKKRAAGSRATKKAARRQAAKKVAAKAPVRRPAAAKTRPKPAAKPVKARKVATKSTARPAKKTAVRKVAVTKATPAKKAPTKAARKKLTAVRQPRAASPRPARPAVDTEATVVRPTVVPDPVVSETPSPVVVIRPQTQVQPELAPQAEPEPEPAPEPAVARRAGQRVPLPSWSDVLLGVAPPETSREASARRRRKSG